jgi:hypothetical protein
MSADRKSTDMLKGIQSGIVIGYRHGPRSQTTQNVSHEHDGSEFHEQASSPLQVRGKRSVIIEEVQSVQSSGTRQSPRRLDG